MLLNLWSCPRNVSTAMMYSFAQRPDTAVFDEPLYPHFLRVTGAERPDREETMYSMETDGQKVVNELLLGPQAKPVSFFKQMSNHLLELDDTFLGDMHHIIFIRDPALVLASYSKVVHKPDMQDIGIQHQVALYRKLMTLRKRPFVLDSRELLTDPEGSLRALCAHFDIPFYSEMLQWKAGPRPEDGVWAKYWYAGVHRSTGFQPYRQRTVELNEGLSTLERECRPLYKYLRQFTYKLDSQVV